MGSSGMAHVAKGYPLYYDAVNEKGLGMAGLELLWEMQPTGRRSRIGTTWPSSSLSLGTGEMRVRKGGTGTS